MSVGSTDCAAAKKILSYEVYSWSSYEANFHPMKILEDKPHDQSSRWLSQSNNPPQFLVLKLASPAVVQEITFGKFEKPHVSDLKRFKVFGGLEEESLTELLDSGLKDEDSCNESFHIRHRINNVMFPCRYIKIVPLQTRSPNFGYSVWHVLLQGFDDAREIKNCVLRIAKLKETEAIRLCLKHFRQHNYVEAFESLQKKTKVVLEDPLLTKLHRELVHLGNYESSECIIDEACREGLFDGYVNRQELKARWTLLLPPSEGCNYMGYEIRYICDYPRPGMRGGHQMCIDSNRGIIYMFGGWDGTQDLGDLWRYSISENKWKILSENVQQDGGPGNRSCHKMVIDRNNQRLYVLGRYVETKPKGSRSYSPLKGDFYYYDIAANKWTMLCSNTESEGGPPLLYDHQMCFDHEKEEIYVFGGQFLKFSDSITGSSEEDRPLQQGFCGLFLFDCRNNNWKKLSDDCESFKADCSGITPRTGHVMVIDDSNQNMYIFGGQRGTCTFSDFYLLNTNTNTPKFSVVCDRFRKPAVVPPSGFTQRATIDPGLGEIHVLSGRRKGRDQSDENMCNSIWVYKIQEQKWSCVYRNDNTRQHYWSHMQYQEPRPRYAHQFVYDTANKVHYMFGGNPGKLYTNRPRLDDFWQLQLVRVTKESVARRCLYLLRKQRFLEHTKKNPVVALEFLQSNLDELIDHKSEEESKEFQQLASLLFNKSPPGATELTDQSYEDRMKLFNTLVSFFPEDMAPPKSNLTDLITF